MVENEGEQLFLVKNLFSLKKVSGKILFSNENKIDLEIVKYPAWTTNNRLVFMTIAFDFIVFSKKAEYQYVHKNHYKIHHKCFDDLKEWLKEKRETNLIL
jgi:hypothetical protein